MDLDLAPWVDTDRASLTNGGLILIEPLSEMVLSMTLDMLALDREPLAEEVLSSALRLLAPLAGWPSPASLSRPCNPAEGDTRSEFYGAVGLWIGGAYSSICSR
jgi:hypothetical protein